MAGSALSLEPRRFMRRLRRSVWMGRARRRSIMWSGRCWATGWPAWTRTRRRGTGCRLCTRRRRGFRWSSAGISRRAARRLSAAQDELEGLPADYLARHPLDADGQRDVDDRPAGHAAGDDVCGERGAAGADVSGLQHAGLSGQPADSAGFAGDAAGDCDAFWGSGAGPTWRRRTR